MPALLRNSLKPLMDLINIIFRGRLLGFFFRGSEVLLFLRSPCLLKEPLLIGDSQSVFSAGQAVNLSHYTLEGSELATCVRN